MVLWEITLATAYFLGLKRTYKLALRIQRRVVGPNHPKIRHFLHSRTRIIFNTVVKVHQNIQHRDIEVGRNIGNWVLRWLNRMKPSAQIRAPAGKLPTTNSSIPSHLSSTSQPLGAQRPSFKSLPHENKGRLFFSPLNIRPKSFPTIAMMMQRMKPASINSQHRHIFQYTTYAPHLGSRTERLGVFRKDIAQWMLM